MTLTLDLDLKVYDSGGNMVGYSDSWDNSYEVAEFEGSPGETYTIRIRRRSGADDTWYGIAWTVTGGLLIAEAVAHRSMLLEEIVARIPQQRIGGCIMGWCGRKNL